MQNNKSKSVTVLLAQVNQRLSETRRDTSDELVVGGSAEALNGIQGERRVRLLQSAGCSREHGTVRPGLFKPTGPDYSD